MESPFSAVILSGEKTRPPFPTSTEIFLASDRGRMARSGRAWRSMTGEGDKVLGCASERELRRWKLGNVRSQVSLGKTVGEKKKTGGGCAGMLREFAAVGRARMRGFKSI